MKSWYKVSISFEYVDKGIFKNKTEQVNNYCEEFVWAESEDEAKKKYYYTYMLEKGKNSKLVVEKIDEDCFYPSQIGNFFLFVRPSTLKEYINDRDD